MRTFWIHMTFVNGSEVTFSHLSEEEVKTLVDQILLQKEGKVEHKTLHVHLPESKLGTSPKFHLWQQEFHFDPLHIVTWKMWIQDQS